MREALLVELLWHRAQGAVLVLLVTIATAHGAHQPWARGAVDHQHRTTIYLFPKQRLYRASADVDIVRRCREAGQAQPFECFKRSLLGDRALGDARWIADQDDFGTYELLVEKDGP